jgi:hypothetical protein
MIHEVDEALRRMVRGGPLTDPGTEVVFDAPTRDWAARRTAPTVDLYLYDIREDVRRRTRGLLDSHGPDGRVAARHLPPRYVKLSYLLTAWTQRPEDEHRLLADLLDRFLAAAAIPADLLGPELAALGLPVPLTVALPPEDRSFADVWSALGGELKPSLDVVVCAPTRAIVAEQAGPPVEEIVVEVPGVETVVATVVDPRPGDSTGSRPAMTRRAGRPR